MDPVLLNVRVSQADQSMLRELKINDFALVGDLDLEFGPGLNVITGETGAGKSVIVEAIGILLGDRASTEMIRSGCEHAEVQGLLDGVNPECLEAAGLEPDNHAVVRRRISLSSSNRIYLNGGLVTGKVLKDFGMSVADLHGQFEHQSLLDESRQLELLDAAGGLAAVTARCRDAFLELTTGRSELERLRGLDRTRAEKEEFLRFQAGEIQEADLKPGEEEQLETDRVRAANTEKLAQLADQTHQLLRTDERGVLDQLYLVLKNLEAMAAADPSVVAQVESLQNVLPVLEDMTAFLRTYLESLQDSSLGIDEILSRLEKISRLKKKYGPSVEDILARLETLGQELAELDDLEHELARAEKVVTRAGGAYDAVCDELRTARLSAAAQLADRICLELRQLDMKDARFEIRIEEAPEGPEGRDRVRFLFTANPGQPVRPLERVASGGELSRVMLAVKTVMGSRIPVMVFDEIDAGIGGATATALGQRLSSISEAHQVICVTHLAQIACFADRHLAIEKKRTGDTVEISARLVREDDRVQEMARMLSGTNTEASLGHARELLARATADRIAQRPEAARKPRRRGL